MQTVGTTVNVKYAYDEARIMDIATRYGDSVIESAMKSNIIASVKEVVGRYSIYELVEKQPEVTNCVSESILARMVDYPITISQTTITNWDWSDDFDRQIKETANRTQQVKQADSRLHSAHGGGRHCKLEIAAKAGADGETLRSGLPKEKQDDDRRIRRHGSKNEGGSKELL